MGGTLMGGSIWEAVGWAGVYGSWWEPDRSAPPDRSRGRAKWEGGGGQPQQQGQVVMGKDRNKGLEETFPVVQSVPNIRQRCPNTSSALSLSQSPYLPVLVEERLATAWCRHMLLCQRAAAGSGWRLKALEAASGACSFPSH